MIKDAGTPFWKIKAPHAAFTLVEVMTAMLVLSLLVLVLSSLFSQVVVMSDLADKRMSTVKEVEQMFDRLNFDLNAGINQSSLGFQFYKNQQSVAATSGGTPPSNAATGNDSVVILSNSRTSNSAARFAKIGYEVELTPVANFVSPYACLGRWVGPFLWTDSPPSATSPIALSVQDAGIQMQPVADGIIRLEFAFLQKDTGKIVANPPTSATNIAAVICAVAVVDDATMKLVTPAQLQQAALLLPDAANDAGPKSLWKLSLLSGAPLPIQRNIQFHQRYFYLK